MIAAERLAKTFGDVVAVEGVSFTVARGEVVGFLGPNGAGKTTTLRMLAGVFPPTGGRATIDGHDLTTAPLAARRRLGYAPERPALHGDMTVHRQLEFAAAMRDAPRPRAAVAPVLERLGLTTVAHRRIRTLSKGFRQRVGLAVALAGAPPALLLDEPLAGLDPAQSAEARTLVRELGRTHAVLVSSHQLADVEHMCDRVVILHRGRVLACDTPAALEAQLRPAARIDVEALAPLEALAAALGAVPGVARVEPLASRDDRARCRVEVVPGREIRPALAAAVAAQGWGLVTLAPIETHLEEAFLALVQQ
ncbi:MAG: ABC transporter ATP-binding protein [Candidatus Binatia bacterium]